MKKEMFFEKWYKLLQDNTVWGFIRIFQKQFKQDLDSLDNWISVKDELPKIETPKDYRVGWIIFDGDIVTITTQHPNKWNKDGNKVTFWQPRPQRPKGANDG